MIFKRRTSAMLLLFLIGAFVADGLNDDFKFDRDDLQVSAL